MKIKEILSQLYGSEDSKKALARINILVESYQSKIQSTDHELSEKDVILICYADQISHLQGSPLANLKFFMDHYLDATVNSIHLLPFYPFSSDDGFAVKDYYEVDRKNGTWADIKRLGADYRLMFDAVINHISSKSNWFEDYCSDKEAFKDFFIAADPTEDYSQVVRPRALPLLTKFKDSKGQPKYLWTTFSEDQVDLNYRNYKVLTAVLEVLLFYIAHGAKFLRLDAVGFLWKKPGTTCLHLEETHLIIKLLRQIIQEIAPETMLVTETNVPHKENVSYFGNGKDEAQMVYNFTLPPLLAYSVQTGSVSYLTQWAETLELPSDQVCFFNFTASHDGVGVRPLQGILPADQIEILAGMALKHGGNISYKMNSDGTQSPYELNCNYLDLLTDPAEPQDIRVKRFLLSQAVMLAMPGIPGVYFHSLVGSENFHEGVKKTGRYRTINREKLTLNDLIGELKDTESIRAPIFQGYKKLLEARTNSPAFHPRGKFEFPKIHESVFAILRIAPDEEEKILALFNFSDQPIDLKLNEKYSSGKDQITGEELDLPSLTLDGYQVVWLEVS